MHQRRSLPNRVALWSAAAVLLIALYAAGAPIVIVLANRHLPSSLSFLEGVYAPLSWYSNNTSLPGSRAYSDYATWCINLFRDEMMIYDVVPMPADRIVPERPVIPAPE